MKVIIGNVLLAFFFSLSVAHAQIQGEKSLDPYTAKDGTVFKVGDKLKIGTGTRESGTFKYIYQPPNALVGLPQTHLESRFGGMEFQIKFFKIQGSKRSGYKTVAVINPYGAYNYVVDLDLAIEAGEVITENSKKGAVAAAPAPSKADELLKLKQLLDAGAITQAEYDLEKKKILEK